MKKLIILFIFLMRASLAFGQPMSVRYDPLAVHIAGTDAQTKLTFTDADHSPAAVGELLYDNTVAGLLDGALCWYDDDAVRYLVDLATLPVDDDYVVAYDAGADGWYMMDPASVVPTAISNLTGDVTSVGNATTLIEWATGNVTYVPLVGNIETYIAAATAGDTLILAAGTYTITDDIDITKAINIIGQGRYGTIITTTTDSKNVFHITASNVGIYNCGITIEASGTTAVLVDGTGGTILTNVFVEGLSIIHASHAGVQHGIHYKDASGVIKACLLALTSTDESVLGIYIENEATAEAATGVRVLNVVVTAAGGTTPVAAFACQDDNATQDCHLEMFFCSTHVTENAACASGGLYTFGGANALATAEYCCLKATDYDAFNAAGTLTLRGVTLYSNTISGTVTVQGSSQFQAVIADSFDGKGAVDMDYGSADVTDHTFETDGGTVILDGSITVEAADASPNANGEIVYDNVVAGLDDGAFAYFGGGDTIYYLLGYPTVPTDAEDDYHLAYDKDTDRMYWKVDADTGGSTAYDDIGDPDAAGSISFDDGETVTYDGANEDEVFVTISLNAADLDIGDTTALLITAVDNDDAQYIPLSIHDDQDGDNDILFQIDYTGAVEVGEWKGTEVADAYLSDTHAHAADSIDAITEIAAALKTGADGTLITGTAGADGQLAMFNADGDLVDATVTAAALAAIDTEAELEALLELQDLQGAVTDGQVPDNITVDLAAAVTNATFTTALTVDTGTLTLTANVANNSVLTIGAGASSISGANTGDNTDAETGDSATAFFDAGTIEHEWGGLQADVSAYTGLIGITGADTTVEVDLLSELLTAIGDVTAFITDDDMPAAGTDPDVDATGEIGRDTDDHALRGYDGSAQYVYSQKDKTFNFHVENPDDLETGTGRADKWVKVFTNNSGFPLKIKKIEAWSDSDNYDFDLFETNGTTDFSQANDSAIDTVECETDSTGIYTAAIAAGFDDDTIDSGDCILFVHKDGETKKVSVTVTYYLDGNVD